uniref:BTB domain-containing protein n=1 Tax=Panagrolaimus davidi TaxID=227884 RepID=A0A914PVM8_9BILA
MFHKTGFVQKSYLSELSKTTIKFDENLEFDVVFKCFKSNSYLIENIKGDLEITRITRTVMGREIDVTYDKINNTFVGDAILFYAFYITANIKIKEMKIEKRHIGVRTDQLGLLKCYQFVKGTIYLPASDGNLKLPYYVTKIQKNDLTGNDIEVLIENPYYVEIEGKKGDYKMEHCSNQDISVSLTFLYDPSISSKPSETSFTDNKKKDSFHATIIDESRPQSTLPSESTKEVNSYWYEIMSNERFADMFFVSSDNVKIPSNRCILYKASQAFAKIIDETSELPVTINVEEFNAQIIKASVDFLYGKNDSIKGKEIEIFKFAAKYNIKMLMDACCSYFEESVNPSNVCEFIQIAYSYNFEELKQKCLKILVEKKKEINASKFADLPKNIISDFFAFF